MMIDKDLDHIEELIKSGKLDHDSSQDLARYSGAILNIVKDLDQQQDAQKKSLSKLTDKQLLEMAEDAVKKLKDQK